ncbi:TPA: hypothetical protein ACG3RE_003843 [Clostridioides difficile]|nr:hypothetical protein [Clostridioides difficile]
MDIKNIKESFQKKPIGWISGVLIIAIIIIPLIVTFTISVRNPIFSFNESNGWLGFWGSYLGGILGGLATLVAVVITTNQTRKIQRNNTIQTRKIQKENRKLQERLISIEEENQLKEYRTFFTEGAVRGDFFLNTNKFFFKGDVLLRNKEYKEIESRFKANPDSDFSHDLTKTIFWFKFIKNIGEKPMFNVNISIKGDYVIEKNKNTDRNKELLFFCDYIENGRSVILPLFKLYEKKLCTLEVNEIKIEYETGIFNIKEKIIATMYYSNDECIVKKEIEHKKISSSQLKSEYTYIDKFFIQ